MRFSTPLAVLAGLALALPAAADADPLASEATLPGKPSPASAGRAGASVQVAFAVAAGVGVFFGFCPARKAARLDPIEALRYQ